MAVQLPTALFCSAAARSGSPYWAAGPARAEPAESFRKAELMATDPGAAGAALLNVPYALLLSSSPGLLSVLEKVLLSLHGGGGCGAG